MKITTPYLGQIECAICLTRYDVMAPDGIDESEAVECPKCEKKSARLILN